MHRRIPSRGVLRVPEATREAAMAAFAKTGDESEPTGDNGVAPAVASGWIIL
jgi:hypothetical protein